MGILTDFFVASEEELRKAFPHRVPVADQPVEREVRNPFTGKTQKSKEWKPAKRFPKLPKGDGFPSKAEREAVRRLPHVEWKGVDQVKLGTLQQLLAGGEWQSIMDQLSRPALLAPPEENSWVYRLPQTLVEAVARIDKVGPVAKKWAATDEWGRENWKAKDASEIIEVLRDLAKQALAESKGMYLWVGL